MVNTDLSANQGVNSATYPFSTFNSSLTGWGWGFTLPAEIDPNNTELSSNWYTLSDYYEVFRFNDVVPGKYVGNLINWDDEYQTTVDLQGDLQLSATYLPSYLSDFADTPLAAWDKSGGIVDQNLSYQLAVGLNLLSATS